LERLEPTIFQTSIVDQFLVINLENFEIYHKKS
jgi:hypothetical protein